MASNPFKGHEHLLLAVLAVFAIGVLGFLLARSQMTKEASRPELAQPAAPVITRLPPRRFGPWTLLCVEDQQKAKRCNLLLQVVNKSRKHLLLRLVVSRGPKGRAMFSVETPPNAAARKGVRLIPGTAPPVDLPFVICGPLLCDAAVPLSDGFVNALSSAAMTDVTYVGGNGRTVSYKLPTGGFASGYAAWLAEYPAPQVR